MNHSHENDSYDELAARWVDGSISPEQRNRFNAWYEQGQDKPIIVSDTFVADKETHKARIYQKILAGMEHEQSSGPKKLWSRIIIAASIAILFSAALYLYTQKPRQFNLNELAKQYGPGSQVAILTDPDGKQSLLEGPSFKISSETGFFNSTNGTRRASITTPRGSRYQVLLEDGTKVWLGTASTITYPLTFDKHTRTVQLSGEAYFEVAHQQQKPFHVKIASPKYPLDITVIGTKFNVSAYPEDPQVQTRVFEGSVKLSSGNHTTILTKGQKVIFKDGMLLPKHKNTDENWIKEGILYFDQDDIRQVMRMLAREYNVQLVYHGRPNRMYLSGEIRRETELKKVLHLIQIATNYQFLLEEGRVTVFEPNTSRY